MNNVVDEVLASLPKYRILDSGGNVLYSGLTIELETAVVTAGTPLNKALFDSIQADLNTRLLSANKTTQAQAEAGSNNTNYMTALRTKQFCDKNVGVKITRLDLASSGTTNIDLTQYFGDNVQKVEVLFDISFSSYRGITLEANNLRVNYGGTTGTFVTSRNLLGNSSVHNAIGKLELYPLFWGTNNSSGIYVFTGVLDGNTSGTTTEVSQETGSFSTLTSLKLGSGNTSQDLAILQYYV